LITFLGSPGICSSIAATGNGPAMAGAVLARQLASTSWDIRI
jgi:hypothetical protein